MATTKRAPRTVLYTLTLVEVTYAQEVRETVASMRDAGHLRTMRALVTLTMRIGRQETRTPLLVDVPASELAEAERLVSGGIRQIVGERYILAERQRGRVIRDRETTARRNQAVA